MQWDLPNVSVEEVVVTALDIAILVPTTRMLSSGTGIPLGRLHPGEDSGPQFSSLNVLTPRGLTRTRLSLLVGGIVVVTVILVIGVIGVVC
jgi:hypothetical protein